MSDKKTLQIESSCRRSLNNDVSNRNMMKLTSSVHRDQSQRKSQYYDKSLHWGGNDSSIQQQNFPVQKNHVAEKLPSKSDMMSIKLKWEAKHSKHKHFENASNSKFIPTRSSASRRYSFLIMKVFSL
jgi:hypothetical protein